MGAKVVTKAQQAFRVPWHGCRLEKRTFEALPTKVPFWYIGNRYYPVPVSDCSVPRLNQYYASEDADSDSHQAVLRGTNLP